MECSHGLRLDPNVREEARRRLLSIRGHVEGISRMLNSEEIYCVDALRQIKAVQAALGRVGDMILKSHLKDHVVTAEQRGDIDEIVSELMELLTKYR